MLSRAARGTTTRPGRYKRYSPKEYPRYDNYNAIEVDRYTDIPYDFDGAMGVPITFLDKYKGRCWCDRFAPRLRCRRTQESTVSRLGGGGARWTMKSRAS